MVKKAKKNLKDLEKKALFIPKWIGTIQSLILHTLFFIGIFFLYLAGLSIDKILLILTTAVSLEAIYLSIFIQMTVNQHTTSLESVEDDIEEIQEDVKGLEDEVEDISEEIEEDVLQTITTQLKQVQQELSDLKKHDDAK